MGQPKGCPIPTSFYVAMPSRRCTLRYTAMPDDDEFTDEALDYHADMGEQWFDEELDATQQPTTANITISLTQMLRMQLKEQGSMAELLRAYARLWNDSRRLVKFLTLHLGDTDDWPMMVVSEPPELFTIYQSMLADASNSLNELTPDELLSHGNDTTAVIDPGTPSE